MKYFATIFAALIFSGTAFAALPSDESINKLIDVSQAMQGVKSIRQQVDGMVQNTMKQATHGQTVTPEQQKILDAYQEKIRAIAMEQLDPEHLKAMTMQIYRDSFSQEEIDQLIVFYESPTGKMFASKMPIIMQKSMLSIQQRIVPMMKEMQQATKEMQEQLNTLKQDTTK